MKKFIKFDFVDYEETKKFNFNLQNRKIDRKHVDEIKKQCMRCMDTMPAIDVNLLSMNITDGQHRVVAFHELIEEGSIPSDTKIKVNYFTIDLDEELDTIIDVNSNKKSWNLVNYVESEIAGGNKIYIKFDEWCKKHMLSNSNGTPSYRYGAAIILGKGCQKRLQDRTFKFTDDDEKKGEVVHSEMVEILKVLDFPMKGCWIESMAIAWHKVRNLHDFKSWMKEIKKQKGKLSKSPHESKSDWMKNIFSPVNMTLCEKEAGL
jgi:hypothetical protein